MSRYKAYLLSLVAALILASTAHADYSFYSAFSLAPNATTQGDIILKNNSWLNSYNSTAVVSNLLRMTAANNTQLNAASGQSILLTINGSTLLSIDSSGYFRGFGSAMRVIGNDSGDRTMLIAADTNGSSAANIVLLSDTTQGGDAELASGVAANADVTINSRGSSGIVAIKTNNATKFTVNTVGEFLGSGTASMGWTVVDSTNNTACTTICTTPAIFGFGLTGDTAFPITSFEGPAGAAADICFCAGAS